MVTGRALSVHARTLGVWPPIPIGYVSKRTWKLSRGLGTSNDSILEISSDPLDISCVIDILSLIDSSTEEEVARGVSRGISNSASEFGVCVSSLVQFLTVLRLKQSAIHLCTATGIVRLSVDSPHVRRSAWYILIGQVRVHHAAAVST